MARLERQARTYFEGLDFQLRGFHTLYLLLGLLAVVVGAAAIWVSFHPVTVDGEDQSSPALIGLFALTIALLLGALQMSSQAATVLRELAKERDRIEREDPPPLSAGG